MQIHNTGRLLQRQTDRHFVQLSCMHDCRQPDLGAIRLKVRCTEQEVLPSVCYEPLKQLLIDAVSQAEVNFSTFCSL